MEVRCAETWLIVTVRAFIFTLARALRIASSYRGSDFQRIQGQVHFLVSDELHTWKGGWLHRNKAIFCLIGERHDNEIAWHGRPFTSN